MATWIDAEEQLLFTVQFRLSIKPGSNSTDDGISLEASPQCVDTIHAKLQEHEDREARREADSNALFARLLPSVVAFAGQHEYKRLSKEECAPISEFIRGFTGEELQTEETLRLEIRTDDSTARPYLLITRYRGGQIYDILEFPVSV